MTTNVETAVHKTQWEARPERSLGSDGSRFLLIRRSSPPIVSFLPRLCSPWRFLRNSDLAVNSPSESLQMYQIHNEYRAVANRSSFRRANMRRFTT